MDKICSEAICSGCGACVNGCPKDCIALQEDNDGFLQPVIDYALCIDCKKCVAVCPQNHRGTLQKRQPQSIYKCRSQKEEILKRATSGGIFSELALWIFQEGGVVFGVEMNEGFSAEHSCATGVEELKRHNGSKYIGSDTGRMFRSAKNYLEQGKPVLFSGCPCQIAGLYKFLGKDYENLYTVDFVCHGVGSAKIFQKYIKKLAEDHGGTIREIKFRDKEKGYRNTSFSFVVEREGETEKIYYPSYQNTFGKMFADGKINRESCYTCFYASTERVADITLADYVVDLSEDEKELGCSLVLINTEKGENLFEVIKKAIVVQKLSLEQALFAQQRLKSPTRKSKHREKIFRDVDRVPFDKFAEKWVNAKEISVLEQIARKGYKLIRKCITLGK